MEKQSYCTGKTTLHNFAVNDRSKNTRKKKKKASVNHIFKSQTGSDKKEIRRRRTRGRRGT